MTKMQGPDIQASREYELFCEGSLADPYPFFHQLRRDDPVHWSEHLNCWILTRYDDVLAAHPDKRLASDRSALNMRSLPKSMQAKHRSLGEHVSNWLGFTDPPKHTRLRKLVMKTFKPNTFQRMRPRIQQIVDELLDKMDGGERIDFINEFTFPLPAAVICDILGIPPADQDQFRKTAEDLTAFVGGVGPTLVSAADRAHQAFLDLADYFRKLANRRRREPGDDLISVLITVNEDGESLDEKELLGMCVFLFVAGHETTVSLLGNGMLALLRFPGELEKLRHDPSLMESALEEFLRFESPVQQNTRLAVDDLEIGGQHINKGQGVLLMLSAANHDPAQFPDPDRLDIARPDNRHLAFGYGIHFCLGAPLARLEAEIAFSSFLERFKHIELESNNVQWRRDMVLRSLRSLPILVR